MSTVVGRTVGISTAPKQIEKVFSRYLPAFQSISGTGIFFIAVFSRCSNNIE